MDAGLEPCVLFATLRVFIYIYSYIAKPSFTLPLLPADGSGMVANKKRPMGTTTDLKNKKSRHR